MNLKIKQGRKTVTNTIAYIAGFFDGEGCIRIKKASQSGNSYYLWVAITNSNQNILHLVKVIFGGQVRKAEKSVNKTIYHYLITSDEASGMLKVLLSFLKEKKKQAELGIKFHEGKDTISPSGKELCYRRMRELKL